MLSIVEMMEFMPTMEQVTQKNETFFKETVEEIVENNRVIELLEEQLMEMEGNLNLCKSYVITSVSDENKDLLLKQVLSIEMMTKVLEKDRELRMEYVEKATATLTDLGTTEDKINELIDLLEQREVERVINIFASKEKESG
ncbi:hypothetical protein K8O68_13605 [Salipaludibacillus sp. CUR1]|uniref:hypothetical protein n=1 Tax=Salipaludibacillus sp. CUR1 TaxID=2820003 RepID=UPI001E5A383F|nr:hypothetical protein [Salipaludibacillus sp. CUR1]MCE7793456.1 hypothetical protein [Salipaludibacillus sp. CUR1]